MATYQVEPGAQFSHRGSFGDSLPVLVNVQRVHLFVDETGGVNSYVVYTLTPEGYPTIERSTSIEQFGRALGNVGAVQTVCPPV